MEAEAARRRHAQQRQQQVVAAAAEAPRNLPPPLHPINRCTRPLLYVPPAAAAAAKHITPVTAPHGCVLSSVVPTPDFSKNLTTAIPHWPQHDLHGAKARHKGRPSAAACALQNRLSHVSSAQKEMRRGPPHLPGLPTKPARVHVGSPVDVDSSGILQAQGDAVRRPARRRLRTAPGPHRVHPVVGGSSASQHSAQTNVGDKRHGKAAQRRQRRPTPFTGS